MIKNSATTFHIDEVASMLRVMQDDELPEAILEQLDLIYIVAEDVDQVASVINCAHESCAELKKIFPENNIPIAIAGWDHDRFGYPGASVYEKRLRECGVENPVVRVPISPQVDGNTLTEAEAFAEFVALEKFKNILLIAPSVHQPRSFLTFLNSLIQGPQGFHKTKLWNRVAPQDWNAVVTHNGGRTTGERTDFLWSELERIRKYHDQGNVVLDGKVFEYLRWRDNT